jgi:hypothetical protein
MRKELLALEEGFWRAAGERRSYAAHLAQEAEQLGSGIRDQHPLAALGDIEIRPPSSAHPESELLPGRDDTMMRTAASGPDQADAWEVEPSCSGTSQRGCRPLGGPTKSLPADPRPEERVKSSETPLLPLCATATTPDAREEPENAARCEAEGRTPLRRTFWTHPNPQRAFPVIRNLLF